MDTNRLETQVLHQLDDYRNLLIAFSGGLDSTVLLHLLVQLRQRQQKFHLRAVHVHHGLSSGADRWMDHCRRQCAVWQVPIIVQSIQVDDHIGDGGIEAAARAARYAAFSETLKADESLIVAQHLDDQSETFLLALKRGSGPSGLSSMAACRHLSNNILLRPLLGCSRRQIKVYAQKYKLSWIEDKSNYDPRFDRNFLRLQVLPLLNKRWPHFISSVARSASLCAEQEELLDELLVDQLHTLLSKNNALEIEGLRRCSLACRFALLRRWIALHNVTMPSRNQLVHLWNEVALSCLDASPVIQLGNYQIRRFQGLLYLLPLMAKLHGICLYWSRTEPLTLPDGLGQIISGKEGFYLRAPKVSQKVSIRFGAKGNIRIIGRVHSRPIKKLWQEFIVPPWMRHRIPLIYYDEQLIAALGVFICEEGRVLKKEPPWLVHWDQNHDLKKKC